VSAAAGGRHGLLREGGAALLVSLDNLGDLVFASALAPPLKACFPRATLTVWCKEYTEEIARLIPGVDDVVASDPFWDRSPGRGKGSARRFLRAASALRERRFEVAVLAAAPWRTAAATAALGIPVRIGLERRRGRRWLTHPLPPEDRRRPVLAELARLLEPLGASADALRYRLDPAPLAAVRNALAPALSGGPLVALHAFASKRDRCVVPREWVRLADSLVARGWSPLWIGNAAELEELRGAAGERPEWHYGDRLFRGSLAGMAAALSLARLFVGHDSGPMHVAAAFGVPVVGVFAPGEPERTFPQGTGPWRVLHRPSPAGITAEDMLAEVDALASSGAPAH
jgi:ADP-heptose:LPS heptosyltransferase